MKTSEPNYRQGAATAPRRSKSKYLIWGLAFAVIAGAWLLRGRFTAPDGSRVRAMAVIHPELSNAEAGVRAHIAETRSALERTLATNASAFTRAFAWAQLGRVYFAYECYPAAAGCFTNAVALQLTNAHSWYGLAESRLELAEIDGAIAAMQEARHRMTNTEDSNYCHRFLGDAFERLGQTPEALREFEAVLMSQADDIYSLIKVGRLAAQSGDSMRAVAALERAQELAPQRREIAALLAQEYRKSGRDNLADTLSQAVQKVDRTRKTQELLRPDPWRSTTRALNRSSIALHNRGVTAMNAGYFAQAVNAFEAALRADPKHVATRVNLAFCRLELGDVIAAGELFLSALNEEPANEMARKGLAIALARSGRANDAFGFCSMWQTEKPTEGLAVRTEAEVRMIARDYKGAAAAYQRLTNMEPSDVIGPMGLAMAQAGQGSHGDARTTLEMAMLKLQGRFEILHTLARLLATSPHDEVRDPKRALELTEALTHADGSAAVLETRALALAENGRWEEAGTILRSARQRLGNSGGPALAQRLHNVESALSAHRSYREPWPFAEDGSAQSRQP